jgi:hypothetical protein
MKVYGATSIQRSTKYSKVHEVFQGSRSIPRFKVAPSRTHLQSSSNAARSRTGLLVIVPHDLRSHFSKMLLTVVSD